MLRFRRYRVFLVFAVIALGALYHFTTLGELESAGAASVEGLKNFGHKLVTSTTSSIQSTAKETQGLHSTEDALLTTISDTLALSLSPTVNPTAQATEASTAKSPSSISATGTFVKTKSTRLPTFTQSPKSKNASVPLHQPTKAGIDAAVPGVHPDQGNGREEVTLYTEKPTIHWSQLPEHFPIPSDSLRQLPTGKPKTIPKIQHVFGDESATEKISREKKLDLIKKTFEFSWIGYTHNAWMQDELSPVSGKFRNPFCGWAATLVDSLDSLWMMGMMDQFENATAAVKDIDFTTSIKNEIPLFETTIRYLGGLLGAYDISGAKHKILLHKAVELAEILMGAFDTPNRMPITYHSWKPTFASQPHRARTRVVLAELGSLSLEFTRLAQITKEPRYYDAIARITDEFEKWQNNTRMPGLWPLSVDASGCKKPSLISTPVEPLPQSGNPKVQSPQVPSSYDLTGTDESLSAQGREEAGLTIAEKKVMGGSIDTAVVAELPGKETPSSKGSSSKLTGNSKEAAALGKGQVKPFGDSVNGAKAAKAPAKPTATYDVSSLQPNVNVEESKTLEKRQLSDDDFISVDALTAKPQPPKPDCEAQGLASPPNVFSEEFTIGGQADSIYEYLPKEYMLLGGLEQQYQSMYESAIEATKKYILYRPMIPDEKRSLLFAGLVSTSGVDIPNNLKLKPEQTHLTCFTGGMLAVGAKIFGRENDMEIAKKLTDGCVWSYEATTTGIMPEHFLAIPCDSQEQCLWNETKWHEMIAPPGLRVSPSTSPAQVVLKTNEQSPPTGMEDTKLQEAKTELPSTTHITISSSTPTTKASTTKSMIEPMPKKESLVKRGALRIEEEILDDTRVKTDNLGDEIIGTPTRKKSKDPANAVGAADQQEKNTEDSVTDGEIMSGDTEKISEPFEPVVPAYTPPPIPTLEEYAKARIKEERLPEGITRVTGSKYILRPEAIESVFIMYRVTGDEYWREKGWEMFTAIRKYTVSNFGASAIADVTSETPQAMDEMESFWLAETLKYFYLLFSDPSFVSLDDYVFNTEAHPFKRPK